MKVGDLVGYRVRLTAEDRSESIGGWIIANGLDSLDIKLVGRPIRHANGRWLLIVIHKSGEITLPVRISEHDQQKVQVSVIGFAQVAHNTIEPRKWHWQVHDLLVDDMSLPVMVCDISHNGIGLVSEHFVPESTMVEIAIPVRGEMIKLKGTVVYSREAESPHLHRIGIKLEGMNRAARARWRVFINGEEPLLDNTAHLPVTKPGKKPSVRILKLAA